MEKESIEREKGGDQITIEPVLRRLEMECGSIWIDFV